MSGVSVSASSASATQRMAAWRWGALLAFALFAPVGLPAGGADRRALELRRRSAGEPLLSTGGQALQSAPEQQAPVVVDLGADQPLRLVRTWRDSRGGEWLQVEAAERRGWLAVA
jgi:hypothetical protein